MYFSPVAIARMVAVTGAVALVAMQPRPDAATAAPTAGEAQPEVELPEPLTLPMPQTAIDIVPQRETAPAEIEIEAAQHGVDDETICLAKIVHHESANQPRHGQLAVAQVVMNRLASPRFPKSICAIALQPGQFFNVHAYNPRQDHRWDRAVEIALDARNGVSPPVVGEALFFHAAHAQPSFHRSRPRVTQIGHHVFYR